MGMQLFRNTPSDLWDGAIEVVSSAKAADERNRIVGKELQPEEESLHEKNALAAKRRKLHALSQFKVCSPTEPGECDKEGVGTSWVLTWKMADGA